MKLKKISLVAAITALSGLSVAHAATLNVFNWSDYIAPEVQPAFEKETGVKVNYDVYDSNEILESKLMAGNTGYDIVVPTGSFMERQIQAGIYQKLDKSKLPNYKNLDPELMEKIAQYDPDNQYGVPYTWGTIGVGYNEKMVKERLGDDYEMNTLDVLFNPEVSAKLKDCGVVMLDSPAEIMAIALNYLGLDPNSESKADLDKAKALLEKNRGNYKYFHSSQYISDLAGGDICVALGYSGDILQSRARAEEAGDSVKVGYEIPKEGTAMWFDVMVMPKDAPHPEQAYQFMNYMLRPEVSAQNSNYIMYAVPVKAAEPLLDKAVINDPGIYPPEEVINKLFIQKAHKAKYDRLLTRAWTAMKTGK